MRLVYEIRSQLNEWKQQQNQMEETAAEARANSRRLPASTEPKDQKQEKTR
jgi:hypothetical protein